MASTKLSIYQGAAQALGLRRIVSLTENQLSRREFDGMFSRGAIRECLSMGQWKFATRTGRLDYSPSIEPDFGLRRAFDKATDWVRTCAVCMDEYFKEPLVDSQFADEAGFIFADFDTIYAKWVSDDADYGGDYSLWPVNFGSMVELFFASGACLRLTQSQSLKDSIDRDFQKQLAKSLNTDAMDGATKFPPLGSWSRARLTRTTRRDRGNRGSLLG